MVAVLFDLGGTLGTDELDALLAAFIAAVRDDGDAERRRLLPQLEPTVREWTYQACARSRGLLDQVGLDADEVVQEVLLRLDRKPPDNPHDRPPRVAVRAWVAVVTKNLLRDALRRRKRVESQAARPVKITLPSPRARQQEQLGVLVDHDDAEWCAEHRLARRKYLLAVFTALREDASITGLELASEIGLLVAEELERLPDDERGDRERKLAQYAWKLRERAARVLAECLRELHHGDDDDGDEP